jgi:hypothetical protein
MSNKVLPSSGSRWLAIGGWLSLAAALLHVGCIFGGPDWYRFFGAGEVLAQADASGSWVPALLTLGVATVLTIWAAFAFSGAGKIRRLPLLRTGLVAISAIYLFRGLIIIPAHLLRPQLTNSFELWSASIVLCFGIAYAVGTYKAWRGLSPTPRP